MYSIWPDLLTDLRGSTPSKIGNSKFVHIIKKANTPHTGISSAACSGCRGNDVLCPGMQTMAKCPRPKTPATRTALLLVRQHRQSSFRNVQLFLPVQLVFAPQKRSSGKLRPQPNVILHCPDFWRDQSRRDCILPGCGKPRISPPPDRGCMFAIGGAYKIPRLFFYFSCMIILGNIFSIWPKKNLLFLGQRGICISPPLIKKGC